LVAAIEPSFRHGNAGAIEASPQQLDFLSCPYKEDAASIAELPGIETQDLNGCPTAGVRRDHFRSGYV
jgi:hypothetical protein